MAKSELIDAARTKDSLTENLAVTHSTSLNNCVDMFFLAGAARNMSKPDIITLYEKAKTENKEIALKILFWARDVRGGAGERRFFRTIWEHIYHTDRDTFVELHQYVPEYGRWDDLFFTTRFMDVVAPFIKKQLEDEDGLLAKWLPRKGKQAAIIRKHLNMSPKQYRKTIVNLSDTVEQKMCDKEWSAIDYSSVPSVAMNKYRKAFLRNDESRFRQFLADVNSGEESMNADVLFPHLLYRAWNKGEDVSAVDTQWNQLPDFMEDSDEKILPVCDVSGSMTNYGGLPMAVSVSLGVYISERNRSIFKNAFITFSGNPSMEYLQGDSVCSRFQQLRTADWGMNTNIQAVFDLILSKALENNINSDQMPSKILIISDMEFDRCARNHTNLEVITQKYERSGYQRPDIIFWNVSGRMGNVPAQFTEEGIGLVSGFSPSILKGILSGKILNPEALMKKVILSERYDPITI